MEEGPVLTYSLTIYSKRISSIVQIKLNITTTFLTNLFSTVQYDLIAYCSCTRVAISSPRIMLCSHQEQITAKDVKLL